MHLLISLALHYRAPIRFPNNVNVQVLIYTREGKGVSKNIVTEQLTTKQTELAPKGLLCLVLSLFCFAPRHLRILHLRILHLRTEFYICGFYTCGFTFADFTFADFTYADFNKLLLLKGIIC